MLSGVFVQTQRENEMVRTVILLLCSGWSSMFMSKGFIGSTADEQGQPHKYETVIAISDDPGILLSGVLMPMSKSSNNFFTIRHTMLQSEYGATSYKGTYEFTSGKFIWTERHTMNDGTYSESTNNLECKQP